MRTSFAVGSVCGDVIRRRQPPRFVPEAYCVVVPVAAPALPPPE
ncbi:MAG TPA: hypothetical protein VFJ12_07305 [Segeticoccus sp.]|nr:hypothetical protein [Segeticoccus sp.]